MGLWIILTLLVFSFILGVFTLIVGVIFQNIKIIDKILEVLIFTWLGSVAVLIIGGIIGVLL